MALDIGINFRATSGYVTDGTNETYCLGNDTYPTSRGGETFGWESGAGAANDRNRDSGVDRRLAGIVQEANSGTAGAIWRLDLAATGDHDIHAAFGDTGNAQTAQEFEFRDTTTAILTSGGTGTSTNEYMDGTDTLRTEAAWPGSEAATSYTFTTTIFRFKMGGVSGSGNSTVAHVRLVETGGGGGNPLQYRPMLTLGVGA